MQASFARQVPTHEKAAAENFRGGSEMPMAAIAGGHCRNHCIVKR
jgi:hypothetical protein